MFSTAITSIESIIQDLKKQNELLKLAEERALMQQEDIIRHYVEALDLETRKKKKLLRVVYAYEEWFAIATSKNPDMLADLPSIPNKIVGTSSNSSINISGGKEIKRSKSMHTTSVSLSSSSSSSSAAGVAPNTTLLSRSVSCFSTGSNVTSMSHGYDDKDAIYPRKKDVDDTSIPATTTTATVSSKDSSKTLKRQSSVFESGDMKNKTSIVDGNNINSVLKDNSNTSRQVQRTSSLSSAGFTLSRRSTGSSSKAPIESRGRSLSTGGKFVESVRGKEARAMLPGHTCEECKRFYEVLVEQGTIAADTLQDHLDLCSRHKSRWTPPATPEGYWDLSVKSPLEWHKND